MQFVSKGEGFVFNAFTMGLFQDSLYSSVNLFGMHKYKLNCPRVKHISVISGVFLWASIVIGSKHDTMTGILQCNIIFILFSSLFPLFSRFSGLAFLNPELLSQYQRSLHVLWFSVFWFLAGMQLNSWLLAWNTILPPQAFWGVKVTEQRDHETISWLFCRCKVCACVWPWNKLCYALILTLNLRPYRSH